MIKTMILTTLFSINALAMSGPNIEESDELQDFNNKTTLSELECIAKMAKFFDVSSNSESKWNGKNNNGICELVVDYDEYISGITKENTAEFSVSVNIEADYEPGELMRGVWNGVTYNNSLENQTIYDCKISDSKLEVKVYHAHNSGWKKKYTEVIRAENDENGKLKSVFVSEKERSLWTTPSESEASCNF